MHIRKTMFSLGVFFFGVGIIFAGGGVGLGGVTHCSQGYCYSVPYWIVPAIVSFLIAAILLAWSFVE